MDQTTAQAENSFFKNYKSNGLRFYLCCIFHLKGPFWQISPRTSVTGSNKKAEEFRWGETNSSFHVIKFVRICFDFKLFFYLQIYCQISVEIQFFAHFKPIADKLNFLYTLELWYNVDDYIYTFVWSFAII